jgi:hypothetical protein
MFVDRKANIWLQQAAIKRNTRKVWKKDTIELSLQDLSGKILHSSEHFEQNTECDLKSISLARRWKD